MMEAFFKSIVWGFGSGLILWLLPWGIRKVFNLLKSMTR